MEVLAKAQSLLVEHTFTIGITLLVVVLFVGVLWYSMSRSVTKSPVLENQARVNEAVTSSSESSQENVEESATMESQSPVQNNAVNE